MNETLMVNLQRIYKAKEEILEFEIGFRRVEELTAKIRYQSRIRELAERGFIRLATKKVHWDIPPKFPGKPLSEYVKEIKE